MKTGSLLLASLLLALNVAAQPAAALKLARTIPLPDVLGQLEHLALDHSRQRLYLAAPEANAIQVVDLASDKVLRPLSVNTPHALVLLGRPNLLYVSSGQDGHVKVFDCAAGRAIKTLGSLPGANNFCFDAPAGRIYVGYDSALGMINAQTGVQTLNILLAGRAASFFIGPVGERIFVNVPGAKHVAVIERLTRELIATWPLEDAVAENHALALDETNQRLFVGCRQPPKLLVLDTKSGQRVAVCDIAAGVDSMFYDTKRQRLYASCGEGFLEVIDQADANRYQLRPRLPTAKGARTSLFAPEADALFLAVPARPGASAEIRVFSPAS